MRAIRLTLTFLGFAAAVLAADPFAGTFKLNAAKSKFKTGAPPKEQTVAITEEGGDLRTVIKGVAANGQAMSSEYTVPAKGGTGKIISGPWDGVSAKRPSDTQREVNYMKGGQVVYTVKLKASSDGKTITATLKGIWTRPARPLTAPSLPRGNSYAFM